MIHIDGHHIGYQIVPEYNKFRPKLSKEDREEVVRRYLAGEQSRHLSKVFGIGFDAVLKLVKRRGHAVRPSGGQATKHVNHDFFAKIDNEVKAYWVGFLLADGCVTNGQVCLRLAIKDKAHVERLKADLDSEHKITIVPALVHRPMVKTGRVVRGGPSAHFGICSDKMVADLGKVGVVPRKSLTATPPELSHDLQKHFWRGMIDADGSISEAETRDPIIRLFGTYEVCSGFADWVYSVTGMRYLPSKVNSIWRVGSHSRKTVRAIITALGYQESQISLERKRERAIAHLNWKRRPRIRRLCHLSPCVNTHNRHGLCQRHYFWFIDRGISLPNLKDFRHTYFGDRPE